MRGPNSRSGRHKGRKNICHSRASNLDPTVVQLATGHYTQLFHHIILVSKASRRDTNSNTPISKGINHHVRQAYHIETRFSAGGKHGVMMYGPVVISVSQAPVASISRFDLEDGSSRSLRNVRTLPKHTTASHKLP